LGTLGAYAPRGGAKTEARRRTPETPAKGVSLSGLPVWAQAKTARSALRPPSLCRPLSQREEEKRSGGHPPNEGLLRMILDAPTCTWR